MSKLSIEPGQKFNRWTILHWEKPLKRYVCQCDCGQIRNLRSGDIKLGKSKSCGCYNIEKVVERSSKPLYTAMYYQVYRNYEQQAQLRKYSFSINLEEFIKIVDRNCHYCNSEPSNTFRGHRRKFKEVQNFRYNGIDRKDNNIGYELYNCVPCCQRCNFAKKNFDYLNWIEWIKKV